MVSESTRRLVHCICYLIAAIVLPVLYFTGNMPLGLLVGIVCAGMAVWHFFGWKSLKRREEEADEE